MRCPTLISLICNYRKPRSGTTQHNLQALAAKASKGEVEEIAEPYAQLRFDETRLSLYSPAQNSHQITGSANARPH